MEVKKTKPMRTREEVISWLKGVRERKEAQAKGGRAAG